MRDTAIRNTHATVCTINALKDAWDKDGNVVVLDESKITTEIVRLQAAYDAQAYARNRAAEYPSIEEVTVALAEKTEGDSTMWDEITAKRAAIKTKYPKPE